LNRLKFRFSLRCSIRYNITRVNVLIDQSSYTDDTVLTSKAVALWQHSPETFPQNHNDELLLSPTIIG